MTTANSESQATTLDTRQRATAAWTMLASLLLLAALAAPFWRGHVYTLDDLTAFHLPMRAFYAACLANGDAFDWDPRLFAGFYFTGEGQVGPYHPAHWVLYRVLALGPAFCLEALASYPFMLGGMYCFLRRLIRRRDAAIFGALIFTFSGFSLLHFAHINAIAVLAHLPWLLWSIDVLFTSLSSRQRVLAAASVALLTGSQLLLGHPQFVWLSCVAQGTFVVCLALAGNVTGKRLFDLGLAILLGLAIGAVQCLATFDAMRGSTRQVADADFFLDGSLHPWNLVQLVAPYLFVHRVVGLNAHELGLYAGAVPLMLIVWFLARGAASDARARRVVFVSLVIGLLMLAMAFGRIGMIYELQAMLPVIGRFRLPCRFIVLFTLAIAVAAAAAFGEFARSTDRDIAGPKRVSRAPFLLAALAAALALAAPIFWDRQYLADGWHRAAGPILLFTAAALLAAAERRVRGALPLFICFAAFDLGLYGLSYSVYPANMPLDEVVRHESSPPGTDRGRVLLVPPEEGKTRRIGNQLLLAGWSRLDGYAGLEPTRRLDYRQAAALCAAGVSWIAKDNDDQTMATTTDSNLSWLPLAPLPRARMVSRAIVCRDPRIDLESVPVETTAIVEHDIALPAGQPGTVQMIEDRPGCFTLRTRAGTRQLLVIAESYHPSWQALVDGQRADVLRANGDFLGLVVAAGEHDVQMTFEPRSLELGRWISLAGLLLTVALAIVRWQRSPRDDSR